MYVHRALKQAFLIHVSLQDLCSRRLHWLGMWVVAISCLVSLRTCSSQLWNGITVKNNKKKNNTTKSLAIQTSIWHPVSTERGNSSHVGQQILWRRHRIAKGVGYTYPWGIAACASSTAREKSTGTGALGWTRGQ